MGSMIGQRGIDSFVFITAGCNEEFDVQSEYTLSKLMHSNYHIPLFVAIVNIPVGLNDLLHGKLFVDDWF